MIVAGTRQHDLSQQMRRKRKPETISSSMEPSKFRTRSMIIVYYDSAVQEVFEGVVRNISNSRNNLRKGRMAAKMKAMTASPSVDMDDENSVLNTRLAFTRMSKARGGQENAVFDSIDRLLETAQSLSEHGAHQFLRDGDCSMEISGIKTKLVEVAELAKQEIQKLEATETEKTAETEKMDSAPITVQPLDREIKRGFDIRARLAMLAADEPETKNSANVIRSDDEGSGALEIDPDY